VVGKISFCFGISSLSVSFVCPFFLSLFYNNLPFFHFHVDIYCSIVVIQ